MTNRTRLVLGSLVGALAIHVALVACTGSNIVGGSDAGGDAGGVDAFVDALAAGDLGQALDVATDAAVDALADVGSAEVRDAHAGDNCQCILPRETTFSFTVNRGRGEETPVARFSTASLLLNPEVGPEGLTGPLAFTVVANATGYLSDGTKVTVYCQGRADRSGRFFAPLAPMQPIPSCGVQMQPPGGAVATASSSTATGAMLANLANDRAEFRAASVTSTLSGDAGNVAVNNIIIRLSMPGGRLLEDPAPAYRP